MARPNTALPMTDEAFERLALTDPEGRWELWDGVPLRKPGMTTEHNDLAFTLGHLLQQQLDRGAYRLRVNAGHLRRPTRNYRIPDVLVIPMDLMAPRRGRPDRLEAYSEPLPLVVEVWSRSTGRYDVTDKLAEYQRRGDTEIWLVHPYERTLRAWRRGADGAYTETLYTEGLVRPASLPNVQIDLDTLFD